MLSLNTSRVIFFFFLVVVLLSFQQVAAGTSSSDHYITAAEYAAFLNEGSANRSDIFYEEKMETDFRTASILRSGSPGNYLYRVIEGRENTPITYISKSSAIAFFSWVEKEQPFFKNDSLETESDLFLSSNQMLVDTPINSDQLSLISTIAHCNLSPWTQKVGAGVTIILAILAGRAAYEECLNRKISPLENKATYSNERLSFQCLETGAHVENRPQSGSFTAGKTLREELTQTAKEIVLKTLQEQKQDGIQSLKTDLGRADFYLLHRWSFFKNSCPLGATEERRDQFLQSFLSLIGLHHPQTAEAIARYMNQTIFADALLATENIPIKKDTFYSSQGLINYRHDVSLQAGGHNTITYYLEKNTFPLRRTHTSFILTAFNKSTKATPTQPLYVLHENVAFSYCFTLNPIFSEKNELSLENLPCSIQCTHFSLDYQFQPPEIGAE